jgi:hypothetical protein
MRPAGCEAIQIVVRQVSGVSGGPIHARHCTFRFPVGDHWGLVFYWVEPPSFAEQMLQTTGSYVPAHRQFCPPFPTLAMSGLAAAQARAALEIGQHLDRRGRLSCTSSVLQNCNQRGLSV